MGLAGQDDVPGGEHLGGEVDLLLTRLGHGEGAGDEVTLVLQQGGDEPSGSAPPRLLHSGPQFLEARLRPLLSRLALVCVLVLGARSGQPADARRFSLDDLDRLVRLSDPHLSPDGQRVVLVVARVNLVENRRDPELVEVDVATGVQKVLLRDRRGLRAPRFSPADDAVAFLAEDEGKNAQLHVLAGEASPRTLTATAGGVERFAWSPDGKTLAFSTPDPTESKTGSERFQDAFEVGNNSFLERTAPRPAHLWLVPASGGEPRRVTEGGFSLATSLSSSPLSFSPDGRFVAFTRTTTPRSGDADSARVHVADVATGLQRRITLRPGQETAPAFSPDGAHVAFLYPRDGDPANLKEVVVAPATGGDGRVVTRELDRSITKVQWMDARTLLLGTNEGTRSALLVQPLEGTARRVDLGPLKGLDDATHAGTGSLAFVGSEAGRPAELYVQDPTTALPRRLTDWNGGIAALALGRTEGLEWPTDDGLLADGVVTFPPDFTPSRAWPLVLKIHGGPTAASNESFDPPAQLLAAKGWIVLQPNYRGSDNRGNTFQRAIAAGAGEGPGRDVMAGIEALAKRGYVDRSRLAVSGWSYGGFMTGWLIGRYPEAFRAAVMGAAALDLFDMWSLSDLSAQPRHALTGSPFDPARQAHFREQSPLTHAAKVVTPTLILSNAEDARVAVTQSYKFFRALRDRGVDTRFYVYPTGGHTPMGPVRQKDVYRRWISWIERRFASGGC
jgi:dipeptidyl aminopeptidase/acylaminoacyl peptidase